MAQLARTGDRDTVKPRAEADGRAAASPPAGEDFGVLVGWSHHDGPHGINLALQSARSQAAWAAREIDRRNFLLTRNQALLLARYLLDATGQQIDAADRPSGWRAAFARIRGRRR